ncbi:MAG: hypothetical protein HQM08_09180 [Candidatus Riflebacteria bacterium]|nr:hypothetical protein [Candidatus Riflebacteria bacterium]
MIKLIRRFSILSLFFVALFLLSPILLAKDATKTQKAWTWMIYLDADNDLDPNGVKDLAEMTRVGSNDWLNIVVLMDRRELPAYLYYVEKGNARVIGSPGELDMADKKTLVNFFKDTVASFPAERYALVVWDHGSGWELRGSSGSRGIATDESSHHQMTTYDFCQALKEISGHLGHKLDVLLMDACLMQMIEVAYGLRNSCAYIVGSEQGEPADGFPYDDIFAALRPEQTTPEVCRQCVELYAASYASGSQGVNICTQSAIDTSQLDPLREALDSFCNASINGLFSQIFKEEREKVQRFNYRGHIDLRHLVQLLRARITDPAFSVAAAKLDEALGKAIIANATTGEQHKNAMGLAVYFPKDPRDFLGEYQWLAFAQDSLWDEMCKDYYKKITVPALVELAIAGDPKPLVEFVKELPLVPVEWRDDFRKVVLNQLNFRLFCEEPNKFNQILYLMPILKGFSKNPTK